MYLSYWTSGDFSIDLGGITPPLSLRILLIWSKDRNLTQPKTTKKVCYVIVYLRVPHHSRRCFWQSSCPGVFFKSLPSSSDFPGVWHCQSRLGTAGAGSFFVFFVGISQCWTNKTFTRFPIQKWGICFSTKVCWVNEDGIVSSGWCLFKSWISSAETERDPLKEDFPKWMMFFFPASRWALKTGPLVILVL